jgi:hypothetical protein
MLTSRRPLMFPNAPGSNPVSIAIAGGSDKCEITYVKSQYSGAERDGAAGAIETRPHISLPLSSIVGVWRLRAELIV